MGFNAFNNLVARGTTIGPLISQPATVAIMWAGLVLCVAFVALRTHIQYQNSKRLFVNDYLIFAALVLHIASAILYQYAIPPMYELVEIGMKLRAPTAGFAERATLFLKLQFAVDFTLWTTLWLVKFSLLFFFWRLFDSVQSSMRIFWWIMSIVTAATLIVAVVLQCHACDPLSNFFVLGACSKPRDLYMSNLVFRFVVGTDIAGDILIMIIPFPLLRKLRVNERHKYILIGIFLLPIIPIIFAILRLIKANATTGNVDPIAFQLYSMLENALAIITSCLPSIRLFVSKQTGSTINASKRYYGNGYANGISTSSATDPFGRNKKGSIPLDTFVETRNGEVVEEDKAGILVKQDYLVESRDLR